MKIVSFCTDSILLRKHRGVVRRPFITTHSCRVAIRKLLLAHRHQDCPRWAPMKTWCVWRIHTLFWDKRPFSFEMVMDSSWAETFKIPFASTSKVTSISSASRGIGGISLRWNFPSKLFSWVIARSPSETWREAPADWWKCDCWKLSPLSRRRRVRRRSSRRCFLERGSVENSLPLRLLLPSSSAFFCSSIFHSSRYFSRPSELPLEYPVITLRLNSSSNSSSFHQPRRKPFGSLVHSDDCGLHSHFAPDRSMPEAQRAPQILQSKISSHVPLGFPNITQNFGADGRPSSFSQPRSHSDHLHLEKLLFPDCLSQISSGLHSTTPYWDTLAPEKKPTTAFNRILPQIFPIAQRPQGFLRSSVQGSSHVPPSPLCHRAQTRSTRWRHSSHSFRHAILPAVTQKLFDFRNFQPEIRFVFLQALWTELWLTRRGFLFFPTDIFCQSSDKSLHTWSSKSDKSSSYCRSLALMEVSMQAPCNDFISSKETHSATKYSMLSICDSSTELYSLLIFIIILRPATFRPGRLVPSCLFYPFQYFIKLFVQM